MNAWWQSSIDGPTEALTVERLMAMAERSRIEDHRQAVAQARRIRHFYEGIPTRLRSHPAVLRATPYVVVNMPMPPALYEEVRRLLEVTEL